MVSVSFIIPVYNTSETLLRRCIGSILEIGIDCDAEIIVVDDGSTHTDVEGVLRVYGSAVRYFRQENSGQAVARNLGLANATKDYVQFVDSDDYLFSVNYREVITLASTGSADLIMFSHKEVTEVDSVDVPFRGSIVWRGSGDDYLLYNSILGVVWNSLVRRSLLKGLAFHEGIFHEDEEFAPLMILRSRAMLVTDYICYAYYRSTNSTMTNTEITHIDRRFRDFCTVIDSLQREVGELSGQKQKALNRRVDQLCQAFAYIVAKQSPNGDFFKLWAGILFDKGYLPLPDKRYNFKYNLSRKLTYTYRKLELAYKVMHLI